MNRKRLPKRDPMTAEIYKKLLKAVEVLKTQLQALIALYLVTMNYIYLIDLGEYK